MVRSITQAFQIAALGTVLGIAASSAVAQSPMFPNTKPIPYDPAVQLAYGGYTDQQGRPFPFRPVPPEFSRPLPGLNPNAILPIHPLDTVNGSNRTLRMNSAAPYYPPSPLGPLGR